VRSQFDALLLRALATNWGVPPRSGCEMVLVSKSGAPSTIAIVIPLGPENPFVEWSGPVRAALYVVDMSERPERLSGLRRAKSLYGLSGAEDDVLARFLAGASVKEIAAARGVAIETVRAQMKALIFKTQSKGQSDLMRLRALGEIVG
jgi:DNA-binding CsgD family transcriptional regulator